MARIGADGASPATESDGGSTTDDTETARTETRATRASEGDPYDDATAGRDVYDPGSDDPTGEETGGDTTRSYPADDGEPETQEPSDSSPDARPSPDSQPDSDTEGSAPPTTDETRRMRDRIRSATQRARDAAAGAGTAVRRAANEYDYEASDGAGDPFAGASAGSDVYQPGPDDTGFETGSETGVQSGTEMGRDPGVTTPGVDPASGVESGSDDTATKLAAEDYEQRVLEQNPDLSASDIAITGEPGEFGVEYTSGFFERRRRDLQEQAAASSDQFDDPASFDVDISPTDEGYQFDIGLSDEGRDVLDERATDAINAQRGAAEAIEFEQQMNPTTPSGTSGGTRQTVVSADERVADAINAQRGAAEAVAAETGANPLVAEQEESVARQITEETGLEAGEDFTVETRGESIDIELTDDGRDELQGGEQFGDWEVRVPFTAGEDGKNKRLEDILGEAGSKVSAQIDRGTEDAINYNPVTALPLWAERSTTVFRQDAGERDYSAIFTGEGIEDGSFENFTESAGAGASEMLNVPSLAVGIKEGAEFGGWAVDQSSIEVQKELGVADESDYERDVDAIAQTASASAGAVGTARESFGSNPVEFTGRLSGSLLGSAAIMGGAAQVSSRAGRASRYAIQPGEELASAAATKGMRAISGASLKVNRGPDIPDYTQRLPGGKIDNEELAIFAGRKVASKTRDVAGRVSSSYQRLGQSQRVGAGLVPPKIETEVEMEGSNNRYSPDEDLLDDALTQYQDSLGASARTELDAEREQLRDVGQEVADTGTASVENQLTFEPEDVTRPTSRPGWETTRPYRGRQQTRGNLESESVGQTWGWESELEREIEPENSVELATESDLGSGFRTEFFGPETDGDVPLELDTRRDTLFESEGTFERDGVFENEFETELTGEQTFDLDQEVELDQEQEFEFGQEQEFGLENELAYEHETELETELEFEAETEQELEFESEKRKKQSGGAFGLDVETDDDLFSSGIADVTEDDFRSLGL